MHNFVEMILNDEKESETKEKGNKRNDKEWNLGKKEKDFWDCKIDS